jgi:chaperonin GroES
VTGALDRIKSGGEGGIRTLGSAFRHYDGLANRCFRPLSHLSGFWAGQFTGYHSELARPERLELPTYWFEASRSIRMSYGRANDNCSPQHNTADAASRVIIVLRPHVYPPLWCQSVYTKGVTPMNLRPLHDRILVRRLEDDEQMRGGLYIPDTAKEKPQQAEVVAVGNGKLLENGDRIAPDIKAGDRILFGKYSGSEVKIDGEEYLILREDEILGVLG